MTKIKETAEAIEDDLYHKCRYYESAIECAKGELTKLIDALLEATRDATNGQKLPLIRALDAGFAMRCFLDGPTGPGPVAIKRERERLRRAYNPIETAPGNSEKP